MSTREEFGKYLLLKKLAEDPLGETFRAGRLGRQGLDQVVLLRVLNGPGLETAALAAGLEGRKAVQSALKSPNIGSGVDVGRVRGVPYVAYDYISGKDLASLAQQARRESSPFPTDHVLLIADRVGLALAAAFEARHAGERVHHGMVVPQLVMISNEGETRLLGFEAGPALAAQAASLPPEIQRYVAPEVRKGGTPSGRTDVFSLGAILYELLTGRALPADPGTDYGAVLGEARLAAEGTPLPQELSALLGRSLGAPDARIADPPSWHKALAKVMAESGHNATTFNLAFFMHNLFREEIERESREIEAEKTLDVPARGVSLAPTGAETLKLPQEEVQKAVAAPPPTDDTTAVRKRYDVPEPASEKSRKGLWIGLAAAVVVAAVAAGAYFGWSSLGGTEPETETAEPVAAVPPPPAPEPEPEVPAGPSPEELQAQIDAMFEERADAMEANLKSQYDERIAQMQRQLQEAERAAAERTRRLEEAEREAEAARQAAAEKEREEAERQAALEVSEPAAPATKTAQAVPASNPPAKRPGAVLPAAEGTAAAQDPAPPRPEPEPEPEPPAQVKRGELVKPGPGVSAPRLLRRASPEFPPVAARLNKEATVDVRVLVDENGRVLEAEVEGRKVGFGFGEAALEAARSSTFEPATKDGVPVRMWTTMRFIFRR